MTTALLQREADQLQERIDCLTRNRDASHACLAAVTPGSIPYRAPRVANHEGCHMRASS